MPFFCISVNPRIRNLTVAAVVPRRPVRPDKAGFEAVYIAVLDEVGATGAEITIRRMDELFGERTKARGVYQAAYEEVREVLDSLMGDAPAPERHPAVLRCAALLAAVAVAVAMGAIIPWATILWMFWSALRKVNGLVLAAETEVLFSMFDWRRTIRWLVNYWRS